MSINKVTKDKKDKKTGRTKKVTTWTVNFYYLDHNGERQRKKKEGLKTQKEAKDYELEFRKKLEEEAAAEVKVMLFEELIEHYIEDVRKRIRATSLSTKEANIKNHIQQYFEGTPINKIDKSMVRNWQNYILSKELAKTTQRTINNTLSAILNYGIEFHNLPPIPKSPNRSNTIGDRTSKKFDFYTADEFFKFNNSFEDGTIEKLIINLLFWSGIRKGELLCLTLNDFDFDRNKLSINKRLAYVNGKKDIDDPKTKSSNRIISVPEFLLTMVREYANTLQNYNANELLFNISYHTPNSYMERGAKKSGLREITVHQMRHSHASYLIDIGETPKMIMRRLGHKTLKETLETYGHLYPNKDEELAERINEVFKANSSK